MLWDTSQWQGHIFISSRRSLGGGCRAGEGKAVTFPVSESLGDGKLVGFFFLRVSHFLRSVTNQFGAVDPDIQTDTADCLWSEPSKTNVDPRITAAKLGACSLTQRDTFPVPHSGCCKRQGGHIYHWKIREEMWILGEHSLNLQYLLSPRPSGRLMLQQDLKSPDKTFPCSKASPNPPWRVAL